MTKDEKQQLESLPGMTPEILKIIRRDYRNYDNLRDWAIADPKVVAYTLDISVARLLLWVPDMLEAAQAAAAMIEAAKVDEKVGAE